MVITKAYAGKNDCGQYKIHEAKIHEISLSGGKDDNCHEETATKKPRKPKIELISLADKIQANE